MTPEGPLEIEAKLRVGDRADFERRLLALGARKGPTEHETNDLLDDPRSSLRSRGSALRVRSTEGRGLLTLKGRATFDAGVKSRVELETGVDSPDAAKEILGALGFRPRFRYEKRRTIFRFDDPARPLVVVDETPIGLFAEIEGTEAAVRGLARELGVPDGELLAESYAALYRAAREKDPSLPPDMTFERGAAPSPSNAPSPSKS
jgi:adenylate cyclase, class 2